MMQALQLALPALEYDIITFEPTNGWATELGDGDRMESTGAPYSGGAYTSPAQALVGSYADGSAGGWSPTIRQTTVSLSS